MIVTRLGRYLDAIAGYREANHRQRFASPGQPQGTPESQNFSIRFAAKEKAKRQKGKGKKSQRTKENQKPNLAKLTHQH